MHLSWAEIEAGLDDVERSPADGGQLALIVCRPEPGERKVLAEGVLDPGVGLIGDGWSVRPNRHHPEGEPDPEKQLTLVNARFAELVAVDPGRCPLMGDQLHVDLDLSEANVAAGSRLAIGDAVIELTPAPHTGCAKYVERFGRDAMRFVNSTHGRAHRLRGANARVVTPGTVRPGDEIRLVPPSA